MLIILVSLTYQVVDADYHEGLGIGCDSAAIVEFSFRSNDNYDTWTLSQPDILLLGYEGTWTAPKVNILCLFRLQ